MNFNFHLVKTAVDFSVSVSDIHADAHSALLTDDSSEVALMALAELVDWEHATMGALTGQGKRCERALKQRILSAPSSVLERMAGRSGCMNELHHRLNREAAVTEAAELRAA